MSADNKVASHGASDAEGADIMEFYRELTEHQTHEYMSGLAYVLQMPYWTDGNTSTQISSRTDP